LLVLVVILTTLNTIFLTSGGATGKFSGVYELSSDVGSRFEAIESTMANLEEGLQGGCWNPDYTVKWVSIVDPNSGDYVDEVTASPGTALTYKIAVESTDGRPLAGVPARLDLAQRSGQNRNCQQAVVRHHPHGLDNLVGYQEATGIFVVPASCNTDPCHFDVCKGITDTVNSVMVNILGTGEATLGRIE